MRIKTYEPTITDPSNHLEVVIWDVEGIPGHMLRVTIQRRRQCKRISLDGFDGSLTIEAQTGSRNRVIERATAWGKGKNG